MFITRRFEGCMEMFCILLKEIAWGKVTPAAEPSGLRRTIANCLEVAPIHVHQVQLIRISSYVLVVLSHLLDCTAVELAMDDADIHSGLLEDVTIL
ncbi:hypothetical protein COL154_013120 [Colletotrichum chrysophilum]|nr:hypothetical protein KNSL1_012876 [Colletotrichum chrysophilum]KAJ0350892.1 hypothetical protein COL154_013120 [Colletotrichum chrysophilum]